MTIYDFINAKEIATYYVNNPSNAIPYLGATLFPAKKKLGLDLKWIKGSQGLPVALMPAAFDTKATLRDRIGFKEVQTEMPFFREAMRVGEKERQDLLRAMEAANEQYIMPMINKIYDDINNLVAGADVQRERMIMQLLATGAISITANRVAYTYDYKFMSTHKETLLTTAKWSDLTNSNPVTDITRWQDLVETDTGNRPTRAICTRKTWGYLLSNNKIKLDLNPVGGQNIIMNDKLLKNYLLDKCGISVAVYNKKYALTVGGASNQYFPDDVFTLIPDGDLGTTWYGTTPEEADLMAGNTEASVQIVNTGIAITAKKEVHPVNVENIVSGIFLPSFEQIDSVFIATVNS